MIERALELQRHIIIMPCNGDIPKNLHLSVTDWELLKNIHDLLDPFAKVQKELEGEQYPTASNVVRNIPVLKLKEKDMETVKSAYPTPG